MEEKKQVKQNKINSRNRKNALPYQTRRVYREYKRFNFSTSVIASYIGEHSPFKMPVRTIAAELSLSSSTVFRAYKELKNNGILERDEQTKNYL